MLNVRTRQQGFLMVEIILTIVVIGAIIAALSLFRTPFQANKLSSQNTIAANLAQKAFETLKAEDAAFWASIDGKTDIDFLDKAHSMSAVQIVNGREYSISGTAEPHSKIYGIIETVVTVSYQEGSRTKKVQFATYFTRQRY